MRISDWSSDVCSSDLLRLFVGPMVSEQSCIRHEFRKERLQPDDAKAFAFDLVDHRAEQAVIAQRLATDTREKGERPRIRPKPGKRRPTHMARQDRKSTRLNSSH